MIPKTHHKCARPECPTIIALGFVCCRPCYLTVPGPFRLVLAEAFRNREQDPDTYAAAVALTAELVA